MAPPFRFLINTHKGKREIGNHHLANTAIIIAVGKNHQWMLKSAGEV